MLNYRVLHSVLEFITLSFFLLFIRLKTAKIALHVLILNRFIETLKEKSCAYFIYLSKIAVFIMFLLENHN